MISNHAKKTRTYHIRIETVINKAKSEHYYQIFNAKERKTFWNFTRTNETVRWNDATKTQNCDWHQKFSCGWETVTGDRCLTHSEMALEVLISFESTQKKCYRWLRFAKSVGKVSSSLTNKRTERKLYWNFYAISDRSRRHLVTYDES